MDNLSKNDRKKCMTKIRSKNTNPEVRVREILTELGTRYRLHRKDLPGNPDIVIGRLKIIFFINGCFWHQHENCKYATLPKSNIDYWKPKLEKNVERQKSNIQKLKNMGWDVYEIWECQLKDLEEAKNVIKGIIDGKNC